MKLILYGDPKTKKNSQRIVRCGRYHKLLPSKAYIEYEKDCLKQITGRYKKELEGIYNLKCVYYMRTRRKIDLVNLLEGTCDLLVNAGVIKDDNSRIIATMDGSEVGYDKDNPRVEIDITEIEEALL